MGLVEGRPDEVVHAGIDDDEGLGLGALHVEHARHQDAGIADDQPARLEDQRAVERARRPLDHLRIGGRVRRRVVVVAIRNAEAAAEIDVLDGMAVGAQRAHEVGQQREGVVERLQLGDLAADMHVDAVDPHARQLRRMGIDLAGAADRNAELVLRLAGRDLGVGPGVDVRIDAQRDGGAAALWRRRWRRAASSSGSDSTLTHRMSASTAAASSASVLPTPENMIFVRRDAGRSARCQFAARHHVGAGAEPGQRPDHRLVGIRLHGVADQRPHVGEGAGEHLVVPRQGRGRIAVERRADLGREPVEGDVLGVEHAAAIVEVMHGALSEPS